METPDRTNGEDDEGAAGAKLIPEWSVAADDQVVLAGIAVVAALALLLGWNVWRGDDDSGVLAPIVEEVASPIEGDDLGLPAVVTPTVDAADTAAVATTEVAATETTASTPSTATPSTTATTAAPAVVVGDVQAAVDGFPGDIAGEANGTIAVLTGFVANEAESREAEAAAAQVQGITSVENNLVTLEPSVREALNDVGVTGATAIGEGTALTVSGTIDTEADRQPALDAAAAVTGVTEVIDNRLNVSVTADLNALPQVQFATGSAEILAASFGDLDAAAALLIDAGSPADPVLIEIQGYTDVAGPDESNQVLSQDRAESVRSYLIDAGVSADTLTATGFGETEQFGADLAANRVVRFQQIDG